MMKELQELIVTKQSEIHQKVYTKSSMIAISHGIEDMILEFKLNPELFVSFQRFEFFAVELDRYKSLECLCKKVYVFAQDIDFTKTEQFQNTIFIELNEADELTQEWNVIVNDPDHPVVFLTKEITMDSLPADDLLRKFNGFLSFSHLLLKQSMDVMQTKLQEYGIEYENKIVSNDNTSQNPMFKKMSYFLNRTLDEIEQASEKLLAKELLLSNALTENLELTDEIIKRLCFAAEYKDEESVLHLVRMSIYSSMLYKLVETSEEKNGQISYAALMHDIGKIGISDSILLKPGRLTKDEFEIMKRHTLIGAKILSNSNRPVIQMAHEIALHHHEKWDGSGYPYGLKGEKIPLSARVVAIADVFDALSSERVYKKAFPIPDCVEMLKAEKDRHFDGRLVDLFLQHFDQVLQVRQSLNSRFLDTEEQDIISLLFHNPVDFYANTILDKSAKL